MSNLHIPIFALNGKNIDLVSTQKYLRVILDDGAKGKNDMYRQPRSIYARGNILVKKSVQCITSMWKT